MQFLEFLKSFYRGPPIPVGRQRRPHWLRDVAQETPTIPEVTDAVKSNTKRWVCAGVSGGGVYALMLQQCASKHGILGHAHEEEGRQ